MYELSHHSSAPLLQALALPPMQAQELLTSPSAHRQSWELELLNVVQWKFLEQQKLTASALPVWPQSRVFVGLHVNSPSWHAAALISVRFE